MKLEKYLEETTENFSICKKVDEIVNNYAYENEWLVIDYKIFEEYVSSYALFETNFEKVKKYAENMNVTVEELIIWKLRKWW